MCADVFENGDAIDEIARSQAYRAERITRPFGDPFDAALFDDLRSEALARICAKRCKVDVSRPLYEQRAYLQRVAFGAAIDYVRKITNFYKTPRSAWNYGDERLETPEPSVPVASDWREICADLVDRFKATLDGDDLIEFEKILAEKPTSNLWRHRRVLLRKRFKDFALRTIKEYLR